MAGCLHREVIRVVVTLWLQGLSCTAYLVEFEMEVVSVPTFFIVRILKVKCVIYFNKTRGLRCYDGDNLNQSVPGGTDRTERMARISGINQMVPQKLKFKV